MILNPSLTRSRLRCYLGKSLSPTNIPQFISRRRTLTRRKTGCALFYSIISFPGFSNSCSSSVTIFKRPRVHTRASLVARMMSRSLQYASRLTKVPTTQSVLWKLIRTDYHHHHWTSPESSSKQNPVWQLLLVLKMWHPKGDRYLPLWISFVISFCMW